MARATWNGQVVAESDSFEIVEGNVYFPPEAIRRQHFEESATHTTCGWKGVASYYHLVVDGKRNADAAWYYPEPKPAAKNIAGYVAFWRGVEVDSGASGASGNGAGDGGIEVSLRTRPAGAPGQDAPRGEHHPARPQRPLPPPVGEAAKAALAVPPGWSRHEGPGYRVLCDAESDERLAFAFSVARGLEGHPRSLDFRWLYDDQGSQVFEHITEQPEYYQTRTEDGILAAAADRIRERVGGAALVELGSGSSTKTRRLLDAWCRRGPSRYLPIDVSLGALAPACRGLAAGYPLLAVEGIAAPYHRGLPLLRELSPLCLVFLGSSIGNFDRAECDRFLARIGDSLDEGDHFLVGLDLVKPTDRLEAAYNDAAGWSAAFTRNVFVRMNRELGTRLDLDAIEHVAWYDERHEQIEIYARFLAAAEVDLPQCGRRFRVAPGELVRTEISRKFRTTDFIARAARFGLEEIEVFQDPAALFAVVLLRKRTPRARRGGDEAIDRAGLAATLAAVRRRTLEIVAPVPDVDLKSQHSPIMSPLAWDLAHIAAYEELWLSRRAGEGDEQRAGEGLPDHLDALRTPRSARGGLELPDRPELLRTLAETRAASLERLAREPAADPGDALHAGGFVYAMVAQHEAQHAETMLATLQLRGQAGADDLGPLFALAPPPSRGDQQLAHDTILVPAGASSLGSDDTSAAYDNERPRHTVELAAFRIDAAPVTNAAWLRFLEDGGYRRPELWSLEGRAWLAKTGATAPGHWERRGATWLARSFGHLGALDPDCPVVHVSWFEADAYARWAGKRLPTEAEWEKAATWDAEARRQRLLPWGSEPTDASRSSLGLGLAGPAPIGSYPDGRSFYGCHQMVGDVWQWTASWFQPYPGFRAFPYREYSEVFFGERYRVLRGGSFATQPVAMRGTFRNWDFPERRQIFAGVRCCTDA